MPLVIEEAPLATVTTANRMPYVGGVPLSVELEEEREVYRAVTSEASDAGLLALVGSTFR